MRSSQKNASCVTRCINKGGSSSKVQKVPMPHSTITNTRPLRAAARSEFSHPVAKAALAPSVEHGVAAGAIFNQGRLNASDCRIDSSEVPS